MRSAAIPPACAVILSACLLVSPGLVRSQIKTPEQGWKFLPEANRFRPFAANWQEARLGVRKEIGSSHLRLDIGSGLDLLSYLPDSSSGIEFRAGVEFFAYGLSTSLQGHRLQIDALDGHFGGSISVFLPESWGLLTSRLRILHLSSHFVDGHVTGSWNPVDGRDPTPFTRDFGELVIAPVFSGGSFLFRPYAGISYSTLVRPDDLARWGGLLGSELFLRSFPGRLLGQPSALFLAIHTSLAGNPKITMSSEIDTGIHVGAFEGAAVRALVGYFRGNEIFHQYYMERRGYWTLGIAFEVR